MVVLHDDPPSNLRRPMFLWSLPRSATWNRGKDGVSAISSQGITGIGAMTMTCTCFHPNVVEQS